MKKSKAISNLTFIALMSAVNVVFALLMTFLPVLSLLLYLMLPYITTMVILVCQKKYYIIYFIASIFLSFIINTQGIEYTIFTLLPSLITGTIFGICIEKKVNIGITIIISSFCQFLFSMATIPLINLIYTNDSHSILEVFKTILGENKEFLLYKLFLPINYVVALAQNIISFLLISSSITRFKVEIVTKNSNQLAYSCACITISILTILSALFFDDLMYLFLAMCISLVSLIVLDLFENKTIGILITSISVIGFIILFVIFAKSNSLLVPLAMLFPIVVISTYKFFILINKK